MHCILWFAGPAVKPGYAERQHQLRVASPLCMGLWLATCIEGNVSLAERRSLRFPSGMLPARQDVAFGPSRRRGASLPGAVGRSAVFGNLQHLRSAAWRRTDHIAIFQPGRWQREGKPALLQTGGAGVTSLELVQPNYWSLPWPLAPIVQVLLWS